MDYIQFILGLLVVLFIYIIVTKVFMKIAFDIGRKLGLADFFTNLYQKIKRVLFK